MPSPEDRPKKHMAAIVAAHEIPYMATASIPYPRDLEQKVRRAKSSKGFRFLHIIVPCPTGWLYATKDSIRLGRLAVLSRVFPLYEVFDGKRYRLTAMGEKVPVSEYLKPQGRFEGLSEASCSWNPEKGGRGMGGVAGACGAEARSRHHDRGQSFRTGVPGAVLASQILATAFFQKGFYVQSFPSFGAERRGAPVSAFVRVDSREITLRYSVHIDWIVLFDAHLLDNSLIMGGASEKTCLLINAPSAGELHAPAGNSVLLVDAMGIAEKLHLKTTSFSIVNTAMVGAFAKASNLLELDGARRR